MQQKVEETQREKEELIKKLALLQQEKEQLDAEQESLKKECEQEKESCVQLRRENQVSWKRTKLQSWQEKDPAFVSNAEGFVPFVKTICNLDFFFHLILNKRTILRTVSHTFESLSAPPSEQRQNGRNTFVIYQKSKSYSD